jgi:hypothetical protein
MPDHSCFTNLIWQIADLLRGPYRPPQYERVMLPMTVLRRFDCVLAPTKQLVAAKQRVLDLLAEKRKAIITTAVTRGLDPNAKLRDSGVPWLGEIPAHWKLVPIRYLLSLGPKNGISPPQSGADEQHAIVSHITHETAKLDAVRAATERTIALLKGRRAALIAAAVTGQLDVTRSAA